MEDDLVEMLRNPSDELVEQWSRMTASKTWRHIDEGIAEGDWNGATALNLRNTIMREDADSLRKLATAIELVSLTAAPSPGRAEPQEPQS